jgi:hypothetical protein
LQHIGLDANQDPFKNCLVRFTVYKLAICFSQDDFWRNLVKTSWEFLYHYESFEMYFEKHGRKSAGLSFVYNRKKGNLY